MNRKKPLKHGTISTYTNYRCRCQRCRAAAALYQRNARARREMAMKESVA